MLRDLVRTEPGIGLTLLCGYGRLSEQRRVRMKSEHDPWYINFSSVVILILVVVCCFLIVAYVVSQSKLWLVPAFLVGIGIIIIAIFPRIRRNILESLRPRVKYERKALNEGFKVALIIVLTALVGVVIYVLKNLEK
jgi:membrane protease YdiL (CAAX protease family)